MNRHDFERLRDLPSKTIDCDIVLQKNNETSPLLFTTVLVSNSEDIEVKLRIELNEQTDSKTLNVIISGIGPICRLEVDAKPHRPYGRHHKHSLQEPDCSHPSINLARKIENRDDLKGKTINEVFTDFCNKANIRHNGNFTIKRD